MYQAKTPVFGLRFFAKYANKPTHAKRKTGQNNCER
jgi:hypothetical protein